MQRQGIHPTATCPLHLALGAENSCDVTFVHPDKQKLASNEVKIVGGEMREHRVV